MSIVIREAAPGDARAMNALRLSVHENVLAEPSRLTESVTVEAITTEGCGWVAVDSGRILGFSIALQSPARIWALFIHPDYEGQGLGQRLLQVAVDWLWSQGAEVIRLCTEPETRAERFYDNQGWREAGVNDRGETVFELHRPAGSA